MRWIWTDSKPVFPHRNSLDGIVGEETKIHGSGVRENREYEHGCLGIPCASPSRLYSHYSFLRVRHNPIYILTMAWEVHTGCLSIINRLGLAYQISNDTHFETLYFNIDEQYLM